MKKHLRRFITWAYCKYVFIPLLYERDAENILQEKIKDIRLIPRRKNPNEIDDAMYEKNFNTLQ